jgi:hypothetical protein
MCRASPGRWCVTSPLRTSRTTGSSIDKAKAFFLRRGVIRSHTVQVLRGIDGTWASGRRRHRLGSPGRRGRGMVDRVCTRGTVRFLRQALEGFGCAASQESQHRELVGDRVRHHDRAPSSWCDGGHWTRFGGRGHDPRAAGSAGGRASGRISHCLPLLTRGAGAYGGGQSPGG